MKAVVEDEDRTDELLEDEDKTDELLVDEDTTDELVDEGALELVDEALLLEVDDVDDKDDELDVEDGALLELVEDEDTTDELVEEGALELDVDDRVLLELLVTLLDVLDEELLRVELELELLLTLEEVETVEEVDTVDEMVDFEVLEVEVGFDELLTAEPGVPPMAYSTFCSVV